MIRSHLPWIAPAFLAATLVAPACSLVELYAAEVFITNVDTVPLTNIEVVVTGASYTVASIAPGETQSVKVYPLSESGLSLVLTNAAGQQSELIVPVYFEPSYRARLDLEITRTAIMDVDHTMRY